MQQLSHAMKGLEISKAVNAINFISFSVDLYRHAGISANNCNMKSTLKKMHRSLSLQTDFFYNDTNTCVDIQYSK